MIKIDNNRLEINGTHIDILSEYGCITLRLLENGIDECLLENAFQRSKELYKKDKGDG